MAGDVFLTIGKCRRGIFSGLVEDEPGVDDLGLEAPELGELGWFAQSFRLPFIGFGEATGGLFGGDRSDPGHVCGVLLRSPCPPSLAVQCRKGHLTLPLDAIESIVLLKNSRKTF